MRRRWALANDRLSTTTNQSDENDFIFAPRFAWSIVRDTGKLETVSMKQLAWGLIGCGDIARRRVAPALRDLDDCDLVAVSRAQSELAESFGKEFGAKRWYPNSRELLLDEEIVAVYLATPVHLHS